METKYTVFAVLLCFGMGFYFGQMATFTKEKDGHHQDIESGYDPKYSALERKLLELEKTELQEFQSIEEKKERYLKANKIYAKVFSLMTSSLNFRLDKNSWNNLAYHQISDDDLKLDEIPVRPTTAAEKETIRGANTIEGSSTQNTINIFDKIARKMRKKDLFSDKGKINNPNSYYQNSVTIQSPNKVFGSIQGDFTGVIQLLDKEGTRYNLDINTDYSYDGIRHTGKLHIVIKDQRGKVISREKTQGSNKAFHVNLDDPNAILVETSPYSFLHLNYNSIRQAFSGYYYRRAKNSKKFKVAGRISRLSPKK